MSVQADKFPSKEIRLPVCQEFFQCCRKERFGPLRGYIWVDGGMGCEVMRDRSRSETVDSLGIRNERRARMRNVLQMQF